MYLKARRLLTVATKTRNNMIDQILLSMEDCISLTYKLFPNQLTRKAVTVGIKNIFISFKISEAKIYSSVLIEYLLSIYDTIFQMQSGQATLNDQFSTIRNKSTSYGEKPSIKGPGPSSSMFSSIDNFQSSIHGQNGLYKKLNFCQGSHRKYIIIDRKFTNMNSQQGVGHHSQQLSQNQNASNFLSKQKSSFYQFISQNLGQDDAQQYSRQRETIPRHKDFKEFGRQIGQFKKRQEEQNQQNSASYNTSFYEAKRHDNTSSNQKQQRQPLINRNGNSGLLKQNQRNQRRKNPFKSPHKKEKFLLQKVSRQLPQIANRFGRRDNSNYTATDQEKGDNNLLVLMTASQNKHQSRKHQNQIQNFSNDNRLANRIFSIKKDLITIQGQSYGNKSRTTPAATVNQIENQFFFASGQGQSDRPNKSTSGQRFQNFNRNLGKSLLHHEEIPLSACSSSQSFIQGSHPSSQWRGDRERGTSSCFKDKKENNSFSVSRQQFQSMIDKNRAFKERMLGIGTTGSSGGGTFRRNHHSHHISQYSDSNRHNNQHQNQNKSQAEKRLLSPLQSASSCMQNKKIVTQSQSAPVKGGVRYLDIPSLPRQLFRKEKDEVDPKDTLHIVHRSIVRNQRVRQHSSTDFNSGF